MARINEKEFLEELKFCIKGSDIIKARALLQYLPKLSDGSQTLALHEISKSKDAMASPLLLFLAEVPIASVKVTQNLYNLLLDKSYGNNALLIQLLRKKESVHTGLCIDIAGDLALAGAVPALIEILSTNSDSSVLRRAIRSLGKIGATSSIATIEEFIYFGSDDLRKEAITALSVIGGPTAIHKLAEAITGESRTARPIIEALATIQDRQSLEKLCGLINSRFVDIRSQAMDLLIEIGPKSVPMVMENLLSDDSDTLIHTLNILGKIGDRSSVSAVHKLLARFPEDSNVRYAAYEALSRLPAAGSPISLARGVFDPVEQVRLAAAKAMDRNICPVLLTGLKNMISGPREEAMEVIATIIDAESENIFREMIKIAPFPELAAEHLAERAPPLIRSRFLSLLAEIGEKEIWESLTRDRHAGDAPDRLAIYVVDDSRMMLKLYMKQLHNMGYAPVTFSSPAEALEAISGKKPDLLITDLNMPQMNGLQLTEHVRGVFPSSELPIIMLTTQSDFIGMNSSASAARVDAKAMKRAGIDLVLNKPFRDRDLSNAIKALRSRKAAQE